MILLAGSMAVPARQEATGPDVAVDEAGITLSWHPMVRPRRSASPAAGSGIGTVTARPAPSRVATAVR